LSGRRDDARGALFHFNLRDGGILTKEGAWGGHCKSQKVIIIQDHSNGRESLDQMLYIKVGCEIKKKEELARKEKNRD